jgi:hypothetical protein
MTHSGAMVSNGLAMIRCAATAMQPSINVAVTQSVCYILYSHQHLPIDAVAGACTEAACNMLHAHAILHEPPAGAADSLDLATVLARRAPFMVMQQA